jgi:hypothetical protein
VHTRNACCLLGDGAASGAGDQHSYIAANLAGGGHDGESRLQQLAIVVVGND